MFYPQTLVEYVTIISSTIQAILIVLIFFQVKYARQMVNLTKEEQEIRLRPWVGRESFSIIGLSEDRDGNPAVTCRFVFKNYGQTPAINSHIRIMYGKEPLRLDDLRDVSAKFFGSIMPREKRYYDFFIPPSFVSDAENKKDDLYVLVSFDYEYAKAKLGTYFILAKYFAPDKKFEMVEDGIS